MKRFICDECGKHTPGYATIGSDFYSEGTGDYKYCYNCLENGAAPQGVLRDTLDIHISVLLHQRGDRRAMHTIGECDPIRSLLALDPTSQGELKELAENMPYCN